MARWRQAKLGDHPIWFHISSVGELEQIRPVLEILSAQGLPICLSYFSPSVPRLVKDWGFVGHADYLPLDFEEEMEELMDIIKPRILVLNRYDLWPNHLAAAKKRKVPVAVVNASTPPLGFFGRISLWLRSDLFRSIDAWTFVDSVAAAGWEPYVAERAKGLVAGDPRVDRALARVDAALLAPRAKEVLARWHRKAFCLVAGSSWPEDELVFLEAWGQLSMPRSLLLVPHEPEEEHLQKLEKMLSARKLSFVRYSQLGVSPATSSVDVLLVDQRGILAEIYGAGQLAYVGGGFRRQIHSIIEPVSHGLPVAFGPHFNRTPEAAALSAAGSVLPLPKRGAAKALAEWIEKMAQPGESRTRAEEPLRVFLQIHRGAGERVAGFIDQYLRGTLKD